MAEQKSIYYDPNNWIGQWTNRQLMAGIPDYFASTLGYTGGKNQAPSYQPTNYNRFTRRSVDTGAGIPPELAMNLQAAPYMWAALSQLFPQISFTASDTPSTIKYNEILGQTQNYERLPSVMSMQFLQDQQRKIAEGSSILPALQSYIADVWGVPWEAYIGSVQSQTSNGAGASPTWTTRKQK